MSKIARFAGCCWSLTLVTCLSACGGGGASGESTTKPASEAAETQQPAGEGADAGHSARTLPIPAGEGADPHAGAMQHPPANATGGLTPPPPESGTGAHALNWKAPESWVAVAPSSPMRRAQYRVPGPGGDGECAVFYFGPGQGGDPMSNAQRWAGQFTLPDGKPAIGAMTSRNYQVGPISVLEVEVKGTYDGGMTMTAQPSTPKPGYMLLGAIAEGPDANWFFKFTGPEQTVAAQHTAFGEMLRSLRPGNPS